MNFSARLAKVLSQRQIIKSMASRNLKDKYVGSSLGIFWSILNPLLIMLVVSFVFSRILQTNVRHFPLLVLSALLPWFFFINSICESTTSMKRNIDMMSQFTLSREIIPVSIVLANFVNFLFGFIIVLPVFIFFNTEITRYIVLVPLVMVLHLVFTMGVSILFSIVNVYFKDLAQLLNVGVMFLFWLTPIFYSLEMIPGQYRWIIMANPGTCYVVIYRSLLYEASTGSVSMWFLAGVFSLISIIGGYIIFIRNEKDILKYV